MGGRRWEGAMVNIILMGCLTWLQLVYTAVSGNSFQHSLLNIWIQYSVMSKSTIYGRRPVGRSRWRGGSDGESGGSDGETLHLEMILVSLSTVGGTIWLPPWSNGVAVIVVVVVCKRRRKRRRVKTLAS